MTGLIYLLSKGLLRVLAPHFDIINSLGFAGGSDGKESVCNAGDWGSIPGSGRAPGEGYDNPLQQSYLENPIDRGT